MDIKALSFGFLSFTPFEMNCNIIKTTATNYSTTHPEGYANELVNTFEYNGEGYPIKLYLDENDNFIEFEYE